MLSDPRQSALFQESYKTALRRDAVVFASMATEIYDTSRNVTLTAPDGKRRQAQLMVPAFNTGSGQIEMMNDLTNAKFEIYADLRDTHETVEEEVRTDTLDLIKMLPPEDPIRAILILKYIERVPGSSFEDIRQFATQQLVRQGIRPASTFLHGAVNHRHGFQWGFPSGQRTCEPDVVQPPA